MPCTLITSFRASLPWKHGGMSKVRSVTLCVLPLGAYLMVASRPFPTNSVGTRLRVGMTISWYRRMSTVLETQSSRPRHIYRGA
jgi:hypothetical protein